MALVAVPPRENMGIPADEPGEGIVTPMGQDDQHDRAAGSKAPARRPVLGRPPADPDERRKWIEQFLEAAIGHPRPGGPRYPD